EPSLRGRSRTGARGWGDRTGRCRGLRRVSRRRPGTGCAHSGAVRGVPRGARSRTRGPVGPGRRRGRSARRPRCWGPGRGPFLRPVTGAPVPEVTGRPGSPGTGGPAHPYSEGDHDPVDRPGRPAGQVVVVRPYAGREARPASPCNEEKIHWASD